MLRALKNNDKIIIRKADKSNIYVILDRNDYKTKLDIILNDESKFVHIEGNPIKNFKKRLNLIIKTNNAVSNYLKLPVLVGDYNPGYIYGNCKIHKDINNPPLRPIISQIPSPTYNMANIINSILEPFLPARHSIRSTDKLLDLLKITKPKGILASLDVESLFTNLPIDETIEIILKCVYQHPTLLAPNLPKDTLRQLLEICTKPKNLPVNILMVLSTDGVAMGSPLGCTFVNYYMSHIENDVLSTTVNKPALYALFVDDIIIVVNDEKHITDLK